MKISRRDLFTLKASVLYQQLLISAFANLVKAQTKEGREHYYVKVKTYAIAGKHNLSFNEETFDIIMEKAYAVKEGK